MSTEAALLVFAVVLVIALVLVYGRMRRLERQLSSGDQRLRAELGRAYWQRDGVLKAIDDALLVLDADRRVLVANPAAQALLGTNAEGQPLIQAVNNPKIEELVEAAQLVRGEGVERRIEFGQRILNARAVALQNGANQLEVLFLRDVTEIQRLERARREMVANISHELSTPITAMGLLADTLLEIAGREKPKRLRKMAADIKREVDTMAQLVQEMRDLALIESGQMPIRLTATPLAEAVQASVEPLRTLAESKEQTITISVPGEISVLADAFQIERALRNIIHNAVKYTPERGLIEISAETTDDEAIIAVRDNGPGIAPEDLPRVFERFYQADRARRSGTGLGLAIVRHIVLAHGGRVWAESVEGQGATFYVALALADSPNAHKTEAGRAE